ncbi:MAG TPA: porin family protein [Vicinamibacterales bacterium]|nr:porin family protein [Vicinamibacterales bacterium]
MNRRQIVSIASAALLVAAFVPVSASAQGLQYGVKGGLNKATVSFKQAGFTPAISARNGGVFGGYVAKDGKKMGLAVEVLWSQKGAHLDASSAGIIDTVDAKLDYVEIPVLGRYNIPYKATVLHVYAGPVFAFSVKDEVTETFRTTTQTTPATVTTEDANAESTDIGIAIGLQTDVHKFLVDVRYNWGLKDVAKDSDTEVKNRCFSVMFGFRFK